MQPPSRGFPNFRKVPGIHLPILCRLGLVLICEVPVYAVAKVMAQEEQDWTDLVVVANLYNIRPHPPSITKTISAKPSFPTLNWF